MPPRHSAPVLILLSALALLVGVRHAQAQFVETRYALTPAERSELLTLRDRLRDDLLDLESRLTPDRKQHLADVEIFWLALERNLRQDLFFAAADVARARAVAREGRDRLDALRRGETPWRKQTGYVNLGYRSQVDGSLQPYQIYLPKNFRFEGGDSPALDVILHGRAGTLSEINFLGSTNWTASYYGAPELDRAVLYPYGRSNNGWRWGGERDAWEALADFRRRYPVDPDRIRLRGFSMGGHGTWHLGLQHPGVWSAMAPGAGFTDTLVYQNITAPMTRWQRALLRFYDPIDYASNGLNLPVHAYVGDQDPALGQHQQMVAALRAQGVPLVEYIGKETPHRYEPQARAAIMKAMDRTRREAQAEKVHFSTYHLRFPECKWVRLDGLARHWDRAVVDAERQGDTIKVRLRNVTAFRLSPPESWNIRQVDVDGRTMRFPSTGTGFQLVGGRWRQGLPSGLRKSPELQGPIDDALFGPVLAVRPTGTPWSAPIGRWVGQELQRFRDGWDGYFRARLPETSDAELTERELKNHHLYLFGDPGSNRILRRLLPKLPIRWSRGTFEIAGRKYDDEGHLPVLIFPNPEAPGRYVVLNVGMTFSRDDMQGSNARQYPHLPDWAVLRIDPDRYSDDFGALAAVAGFFDERWRIQEPSD